MADRIWNADELDGMTPAERSRLFRDSIVEDLDEIPREFLDRVTERLTDHIERTEAAGSS